MADSMYNSQMNKRQIKLAEICQCYQIQILYAFGSRSKQLSRWLDGKLEILPSSNNDGDIGVKPSKPLSVQQKVLLSQALEDFFGLPRIDLVVLPEADPFLAANVIRGKRLFAEDVYLADEYDLYILRRAGDLIPLERERQALILHKEGAL